MMGPLPHPPADPLHILPPWLPWLFYLAAVAGIIWLYMKYLKRYLDALLLRLKSKWDGASPPETAPSQAVDIGGLINDIRGRYNKGRSFRIGLFELSGGMKSYFEKKTGLPVEEMTAGEIRSRFATPEPGDFFARIEESLYSEKEPGKEEFTGLCDHAEKAASGPVKGKG